MRRALTAYTRSRPDPLASAFTDLLAQHARVVPTHIQALSP
ncbi:hypothetical protein [Kitasatospora sp. GAS1066B]